MLAHWACTVGRKMLGVQEVQEVQVQVPRTISVGQARLDG